MLNLIPTLTQYAQPCPALSTTQHINHVTRLHERLAKSAEGIKP